MVTNKETTLSKYLVHEIVHNKIISIPSILNISAKQGSLFLRTKRKRGGFEFGGITASMIGSNNYLFSDPFHIRISKKLFSGNLETKITFERMENFLIEMINMFGVKKILRIPTSHTNESFINESLDKENIKSIAESIKDNIGTGLVGYLFFHNTNVFNDMLSRDIINKQSNGLALLDQNEAGISIITAFNTHPFTHNEINNDWVNIHDVLGNSHSIASLTSKNSETLKNRKKYMELFKILTNFYSNQNVILLDMQKDVGGSDFFATQYSIISFNQLLKKYKAREMLYFYLCDYEKMGDILNLLDSTSKEIIRVNAFRNFRLTNDSLLNAIAKKYGYSSENKNWIEGLSSTLDAE